VQRLETATGLIESNVDNFNQSASIPWSPGSMVAMFWFMMIPALLVVGLGVTAFGFTRRHGALLLPTPRSHGAVHN
jgi:hypothetical protein